MIREILQHPDPRLREVCAPVSRIDAVLIADMFETMYTAPGRGLAGPQVGEMVRLFVMDATWKEGRMTPLAFVNPVITAQGGTQSNEEGCLSIADHPVQVTRPEWVDLAWTDLEGTVCEARFEGFAAACVCHEMDHLDGKLILDYEVRDVSILRWPDKRLRTAAAPVEALSDDDHAAWARMIDEMEAMPGVGLAAVQLGYMRALAVVDASSERGQVIRMANPRVIHASAKMNEHEEASPCLPGVYAKVSRPRGVTVAFMDETGAAREQDFVGLWATSVQHQIDHLAGKMYFDHLSRTRRAMLLKRAGKVA